MGKSGEALQGTAALYALQRFLLGDWHGPKPQFGDRPLARLAAAVDALQERTPWAPTPLDLAVLVRHALRWCAESEDMRGAVAELVVPAGAGWPDRGVWASVGVQADPRTEGLRVTAAPWRPAWVPDVPEDGVDGRAAGAAPRRPDLAVDADPFLTQVLPRYARYRSPGQQLAIRAALMTPPGSTLLVVLPTGDGKSAVFQLLAQYGFDDDAAPGLVVVVTPTVSLALDHQETVRRLGLGPGPFAYQGGDDHNAEILDRIASGEQRLVFAAPEAITRGGLRHVLRQAARDGLLSALVVDEAHLVEVWGKEFRPDFQILAGFRSSLLRQCGGTPFRTILLSATVTPQTVEILRTLFGRGTDGRPAFGVAGAVALRPEIEYWAAEPSPREIRDHRVLEALRHLPRPAIHYVTKVEDAKEWLARCLSAGFGRVAMVTGDTPAQERERVVKAWKEDRLDLVVGTSAFGLGIDKPDVRAVIHACIPESIDRFYQEVGRGGRDGCASLSLLLPADGDAGVAQSIQAKHIGIEKGFERWQAMFRSRVAEPDGQTYRVWLDAPPGGTAERMDSQGYRNVHWNLNTLTLMATARMIELEDLLHLQVDDAGHAVEGEEDEEREEARYEPFQRLRLVQGELFLTEPEWESAVDRVRKQSFHDQAERLKAMLKLPDSQTCWSEQIGPVYDLMEPPVRAARRCGGCPVCRKGPAGRKQRPRESPGLSPWPWSPAPVAPDLQRVVDPLNRLLVWYTSEEYPRRPLDWDGWVYWLAQALRRYRIHNVVLPEEADIAMQLQERCLRWPLFVARSSAIELLPGPSFVLLPPGAFPNRFLLAPRSPSEPRIVLVHADTPDAEAPGARLTDRHNGRVIPLQQFKREVEG